MPPGRPTAPWLSGYEVLRSPPLGPESSPTIHRSLSACESTPFWSRVLLATGRWTDVKTNRALSQRLVTLARGTQV